MKKITIFLAFTAFVFAGQFDGTYSTKKGDIKIVDSQGIVQFRLMSIGSGSMSSVCELSGAAALQTKNIAIFQAQSDTGVCSVMLDFSQAGTLVVKSKNCQMACTDRSGFDGEYKRTR